MTCPSAQSSCSFLSMCISSMPSKMMHAQQDVAAGVGLYAFDRRRVGTAFVDRDFLRNAVKADRTFRNRRAAILSRSAAMRYAL